MDNIQKIFNNIGKENITSSCDNLVSKGLIDSLDIISIVEEIEKKYNITIDFNLIVPENFENFEKINLFINQQIK
ncbi:acyl carrier protein [Campylobacter lari]|uniref:acyl carrier protein n=1 Tax=Campylobacter lari TaxID=201 RepID=UPI00214A7233|nr:acyl carrier protein [Campylobacter lari]EAJ5674025.1 acyl carrier protein [Campylobacter lari]EHL8053272.1 acyl carrier protein [Campylobacter lari]MCR2059187.1 acyl carrier protein [Campylobacter lari subsp. concheus]MCR2074879.1 acyl carrier protein [Campylobacter lari subsp. concheus]